MQRFNVVSLESSNTTPDNGRRRSIWFALHFDSSKPFVQQKARSVNHRMRLYAILCIIICKMAHFGAQSYSGILTSTSTDFLGRKTFFGHNFCVRRQQAISPGVGKGTRTSACLIKYFQNIQN
jgi:hypothetical protein